MAQPYGGSACAEASASAKALADSSADKPAPPPPGSRNYVRPQFANYSCANQNG
ncbi:hypothetical protein IIA28_16300 [candidate division KSB1 bacterium]|nr:hypothetical protein [candidate division KSB1 bacterium]